MSIDGRRPRLTCGPGGRRHVRAGAFFLPGDHRGVDRPDGEAEYCTATYAHRNVGAVVDNPGHTEMDERAVR